MKEGIWTWEIPWAGKSYFVANLLPFKKKEECPQGHRGLFSGLETQRNLSCWIWNFLGTGEPFIPSKISLAMGMPILGLADHCIWEADNLFPSFTGLQIAKNFVTGWILPRASPIPDLDEIWDF